MSDVVFIAVIIVFFVLCALYVQWCDRMIGSDELALAARAPTRISIPSHRRWSRRLREPRRGDVVIAAVFDNAAALILACSPLPTCCWSSCSRSASDELAGNRPGPRADRGVAVIAVPLLGRYMAAVYGARKDGSAPGDRFFGPIERVIYRVCRIDHKREQRWNVYTLSLARVQRRVGPGPVRPAAPAGLVAVQPDRSRRASSPMGAFNAAISFVTNTNWQWFSGEVTMSHLTQMIGFTVQNFVSAAAGMAVVIGLIRGITRTRTRTSGQLLGRPDPHHRAHPAADRARVHRRADLPGRRPEPQRRHDRDHRRLDDRDHRAAHPRRSVRLAGGDQGARHERWRSVQRQLGSPVREPERRSPNILEIYALLLIPLSLVVDVRTPREGQAAGDGC